MNITLQTNNFNSQNNQYKNYSNKNRKAPVAYSQPSFTSVADLPAKSGLLNPISRGFDKFTTWLAENYTAKLYSSKVADFLASKTEKLDSVVDHMQVLGSIIISGMYMTQTLRNQDLDEDRRTTLAVNQGLTFGVSTLGSYLIDRRLDNWWEKLTANYAAKQTDDPDLPKKIKAINDGLISKFEQEYGKNAVKGKKGPKLINTLQYIEDNMSDTILESKIKGMGVLKKLIVFGTVYRFLAPVLVTPFANMIGDMYLSHKQAAKLAKEQAKTDNSQAK